MSRIAYAVERYGVSALGAPATLWQVFDRKLLGEALGQRRSRAGLSQPETARRAGLSQNLLCRAETGSSCLSVESVEAVLRALNADLRDPNYHVDIVAERALRPSARKPRPEWFGVIRDSNFQVAMFRGLAFAGHAGGGEDLDRVEADLAASAEQVVRERALAGAKFRRDHKAERKLELRVAEGSPRIPEALRPKKGEP